MHSAAWNVMATVCYVAAAVLPAWLVLICSLFIVAVIGIMPAIICHLGAYVESASLIHWLNVTNPTLALQDSKPSQKQNEKG